MVQSYINIEMLQTQYVEKESDINLEIGNIIKSYINIEKDILKEGSIFDFINWIKVQSV